jgi:hypothetical protein
MRFAASTDYAQTVRSHGIKMRTARHEPHIRPGFRQCRAKRSSNATRTDHRDLHTWTPCCGRGRLSSALMRVIGGST